jgi:Hydrazine synthase alpha subunit middle domain
LTFKPNLFKIRIVIKQTNSWKRCFDLILPMIILASQLVLGAPVPVNNFTDIIFVHVPVSDQPLDPYIAGSQVVRLSLANPSPEPAILTADFYSACDPAVSFDGKQILFAGKRRVGDFWQVWQVDTNGNTLKRITDNTRDCVSPLYIGSLFHLNDKQPTAQILYVSDRHLFTCDIDGSNPRQITYGLYPEFSPDVLLNGRVIFSTLKPDPTKPQSSPVKDLHAVNIDGTDLMGYLTHFNVPGDKEMVRVGGEAVYFIHEGGKLARISMRRPAHSYRLIADNKFGNYHSPCPMPDGSLIVSHRSNQKNTPFSLFSISQTFLRSFFQKATPRRAAGGNIIYTSKEFHCIDAHVLAPHPIVKGRSSFVAHEQDSGVLYCIDVYISQDPMISKLKRGTVKKVRVLQAKELNKQAEVQTQILGTAPVYTDGSFHIRVPARAHLSFQLLDQSGNILSSQKSWTWIMPRESRGCVGCHADDELAPPNKMAEALTKPAAILMGKESQKKASHK